MAKKSLYFEKENDSDTYFICDPQTGEHIGTIRNPNQILNINIIEKKDEEYKKIEDIEVEYKSKNFTNKRTETVTFKRLQNWGKVNLYVEENLAKMGLSKNTWAVYSFMKSHVAFNTGIIKKNKIANMTRKNIQEELGLSEYSVETAIKELCETDIIKIMILDRTDRIYLNPYVMHKGNKVSIELYKLFDKSIWKQYTDHIDYERRKKNESNNDSSHAKS